MTFSNYHTHTVFCDGKDEPEALITEAIALGCPQIGFSGHSYTDFDKSYCMSQENTRIYKETVRALKEKYKDKITVLMGVEQDYYSKESAKDYDYIIGSVHYVLKDGEYLPVDESREMQIDAVNRHYGGDFYAFAEDYYATAARLYEKTKCNIIGHFDLITKFNEDNSLFDTANPRYLNAVKSAVAKLADASVIFEVNTGAVSRGYKKTPFPDDAVLNELKNYRKPLILSSDCHSKENLLFGFEEEKARLEKSGYILTETVNR